MQFSIHATAWRTLSRYVAALIPAAILAGCGTVSTAPEPASNRHAAPVQPLAKSAPGDVPALPPAGSGRGGYYQDDGPGESIPEGLLTIPDPEPKIEPYSTKGNRPYVVFGKTYTPIIDDRPLKQRGIGSWYGKKFHGQRTSSGEAYDMYKLSAAHPTLPIPSYARVTNVLNGAQVIVRVNDRGPFHSSRIIDLSYTAALKLGYLSKGSSELEVERILPEEIARMNGKKEPVMTAQLPQEISTKPQVAHRSEAKPVPIMSIEVAPLPAAEPRPANISPAIVTPEQSPPAMVKAMFTEPPSPSARDTASMNGIYLQLGAFSQAANAEAIRGQMMQAWVMILPPFEVVQDGGWYRLYNGPYSSKADAAAAAQQLQEAGTPKPLIVQR